LSRYPEATPLPGRPELDRLLEAAGTRLQWDDSLGDGAGGYRQDRQERITLAGLASTRTTPIPPVVEPDEVLDARDFDRRLRRSLDERAYLVLVTEPVHYLEVEKRLRTEFKPR